MNTKISSLSKILLLISAVLLIISIFVPIWNIYLDAAQYPEGLRLQIWANSIQGDVDIINGLNHYIGMKTLHTDDFIEFTVLPYLLVAFAIIFVITAILGKRKWLMLSFILFLLFGILAMVDFWIWEYNYGHNLSPDAPIKVPGMAYQPPLIGFKQLLNFGAYSIPAIGGWLFVSAGILLLIALIYEFKLNKVKTGMKTYQFILPFMASFSFLFLSCTENQEVPIALNKDTCDFCKMTISDKKFAAEIVTDKGRTYKFDDAICMLDYVKAQSDLKVKKLIISEFIGENKFIDATTAWYIHSKELRSPMRGNIAAFSTQEDAAQYARKYSTSTIVWGDLMSDETHKIE